MHLHPGVGEPESGCSEAGLGALQKHAGEQPTPSPARRQGGNIGFALVGMHAKQEAPQLSCLLSQRLFKWRRAMPGSPCTSQPFFRTITTLFRGPEQLCVTRSRVLGRRRQRRQGMRTGDERKSKSRTDRVLRSDFDRRGTAASAGGAP